MAPADDRTEPVEAAPLLCLKALPSLAGRRAALLVAHAPGGRLKPNVPPYVAALAKAGVAVVLVAATDAVLHVDPGVAAQLDCIYARGNRGYDFAAWAHLLKAEPSLSEAATLYLINDSVIGPMSQSALERLLARVDANPAAIVGATESFEITWHLQSYFIAVKHAALGSEPFRRFIASVRSQTIKRAVILGYEVPMARTLKRAGLSCSVAHPSIDALNPLVFHWRAMIESGFPFAKTIVLSGFYPKLDISGWQDTLRAAGFDPTIAEAAIGASRPAIPVRVAAS